MNWDDLTFDQKLFCNMVDYNYAHDNIEKLTELQAQDAELYSYAISLIENISED